MLKRLLTEDGELTKISRRFVWMLVIIYCLIIVRMCFGPQIMIEGVINSECSALRKNCSSFSTI